MKLVWLTMLAGSAAFADPLAEQFQNPPDAARPRITRLVVASN